MKAAPARPLGTRRYRLLGAATFTPEAFSAQKVVARGVLIEAGSQTRINVTSLQAARANCSGKMSEAAGDQPRVRRGAKAAIWRGRGPSREAGSRLVSALQGKVDLPHGQIVI